MELFSTKPRRWLFSFTHPDDEISICIWMRRLVKAGVDVWAGWSVSDPIRELEARSAMASIGVPEDKLFFGGFPDKKACEHLKDLTSFWSKVIEAAAPERIAVGAFECGHIDHDSTNLAVSHANQGSVPQLEIPFYHTYLTRIPVINRFATNEGQEVLILEREESAFKCRFRKNYPSQNISSLLFWYTVLGWLKGSPPALCRSERMRLQTHFDYLTPNLPKELAIRVSQSDIWRRWENAVARYQDR